MKCLTPKLTNLWLEKSVTKFGAVKFCFTMSQKLAESTPQGVEIGRDRKKMRRSVWQKNSNSGFDFVAKKRNKTSFWLFLQILLFIWLFQKILDCKLISFFCTRLNFVIGREESGLCQAEQDQSDHCCSNWSPRTCFFKLFWLLSPDCFQDSLRICKKVMEPAELY